MPRKPRIELLGGLYHVITRGNNRQPIFHEADDYQRFLALLSRTKHRLPFYLYAYCLMRNHVHLLIERQADAVGRIMQRLLTAYSQYYNRKYRRVGHVLQGRHKAILCQSDTYLCELGRYIHLNPVRARIVSRPENYPYSSHRAYLGLEAAGMVDVDPILRRFGKRRQLARENYRQFVEAGLNAGPRPEFYQPEEGRILGTEEFVDATIHHIGESGPRGGSTRHEKANQERALDAATLLLLIEEYFVVGAKEFCGSRKSARAIAAKEAFILISRRAGASLKTLAEITGISFSALSRRYNAAQLKLNEDAEMRELVERIECQYQRKILT